MKTVIVIPARYASTRYPGKPLVMLRDRDGASKSLIQRSWEAAMAVKGVDAVYVATDDDRIKDAAEAFGAQVIMTATTCENGTARCAQAATAGVFDADLVVNLQGDAPLTPVWFVEDLIAAMAAQPEAAVSALTARRVWSGGPRRCLIATTVRCISARKCFPISLPPKRQKQQAKCSITSACMPTAPQRLRNMPPGPRGGWSATKGWSSYVSLRTAQMFYASRSKAVAACSGS